MGVISPPISASPPPEISRFRARFLPSPIEGEGIDLLGFCSRLYCTRPKTREALVPPTLNLENPSSGCDINLVPRHAQERDVRYALSNSFGFGGTNASLVFGRVQ